MRHHKASHFGDQQTQVPIVEYTRELRALKRIGPQSGFELYWPYYFGFLIALLGVLAVLTFMAVLSASAPQSGLAIFAVMPLFLLIPMVIITGALTYFLNMFNSAAQTTNALFSWTRMTPGFQIGVFLGLVWFLTFNGADLFSRLGVEEGLPANKVAQTILLALAHLGIGGAIGKRLEAFILKRLGREVSDVQTDPETGAEHRASIEPLKVRLSLSLRLCIAIALGLIAFGASFFSHYIYPDVDLPVEGAALSSLIYGTAMFAYAGTYASTFNRLQKVFRLVV